MTKHRVQIPVVVRERDRSLYISMEIRGWQSSYDAARIAVSEYAVQRGGGLGC
jgi:hypothetical protein